MASDLLQDRNEAITSAIGGRSSDKADVSVFCEPAESALFDAPKTRTHSYDSIHACETSVHNTQVIDEELGKDRTCISSTSHASTLADIPGNLFRANITLDRSAQAATNALTLPSHIVSPSGDMEVHDPAPTTPDSDSRPSRLPAFPAADEFNDRRDMGHGPASDDELWNFVGDIEDDSVDAVSPDANLPTPLFSAVASLRPPPAETPSEASLKNSCYYREVVEKLRSVFRLKAFRKNQLAAIMSTLEGRDTIVLMPTGGGKSLCYQLPAVCSGGKTKGVTVVVSPLRALMSDQVERLRSLNIDVMMLATVDDQDGNTMHELQSASKKPNLVYITPEKLYRSDGIKAILKGLHARQQLARFVVDEAHLINSWGRDFRAEGVSC
jgi:bloom syndrome protein